MTERPRDFVGYGGKPLLVHWPHGARLAVNIAINYEEARSSARWRETASARCSPKCCFRPARRNAS
jgi:hypothetical protein